MENRNGIYQCFAAMATGLVVTVISAVHLWNKLLFVEALVWQIVILSCLLIVTRPDDWTRDTRVDLPAFYLLPPLIFVLSFRVPIDIFFIYTIIWVACLPFYVSRRASWCWLFIINLAWYVVRLTVWNEQNPLSETLLVGTFHVFALLSAMTAVEAQESNEKTQQLNRELVATQHLLSESSRESERTRIARDLHDLLGHHLTALTINLQVAGHLSSGEAKEKIDQCHAVSKLLLSDVRDAVSELRSMPMVNLTELLEIAVRDIPRLSISLEVDEQIQLDDVSTAEVLLRTVQEAITNTLRHTHARAATIRVFQEHNHIVLDYQDSGPGCENFKLGNGLTGMRERIERLGGDLQIQSSPSMHLRAVTPKPI